MVEEVFGSVREGREYDDLLVVGIDGAFDLAFDLVLELDQLGVVLGPDVVDHGEQHVYVFDVCDDVPLP